MFLRCGRNLRPMRSACRQWQHWPDVELTK